MSDLKHGEHQCPMSFNKDQRPMLKCMTTDCAWWVEESLMCAIKSLAIDSHYTFEAKYAGE